MPSRFMSQGVSRVCRSWNKILGWHVWAGRELVLINQPLSTVAFPLLMSLVLKYDLVGNLVTENCYAASFHRHSAGDGCWRGVSECHA